MSRHTPDGFIYGCGSCGHEVALATDCSITVQPPTPAYEGIPVAATPCDACLEVQRTGFEGRAHNRTNIVVEAASRLMGFCGCGQPEAVTAVMVRYLDAVTQRWAKEDGAVPGYELTGGDAGLFYLVAYTADHIGWTEHGGSVGGAWMTDEGEAALARLKVALSVSEGEETP